MTVERNPRVPVTAIIIGALGAMALALGVLGLMGVAQSWHPLLGDRRFAVVMLGTGVAFSVVEMVVLARWVAGRRR